MGKRKRSTTDDPSARNGSAKSREAAEKKALLNDKSLFAEELTRADHDRERRLYELLGSYTLEDRIQAADVIVASLLDAGNAASSSEAVGVSEAVLYRHLERRLIRSLASGNRAARIGNSYVLTEIIRRLFGPTDPLGEARYPGLTFDRILEILLEKTKPGTNVPGQEERDHFWGQLFGLQCFVESGVLFPSGTSRDNSRWNRVLECLLELGHKKVWLRPFACYVVVQAIVQGQLPGEQAVAATLKAIGADNVGGASLAKTQEGLGIWLAAHARYPDMILPAPWTSPLTPGSYKDLVAVLRSGGSADDEAAAAAATKQGNANAQLHFVWDQLLNEVFRRYPLHSSEKQFETFWATVVDQPFFAKGASDHQKLTGFNIFQKALTICAENGDVYPSLFSNNFMVCLINHASNGTRNLHSAAVQVLKTIEKQVEDHPDILTQVLASLLGTASRSRGIYEFDERVKSTGDGIRPVERILRFADADNVDDVIQILQAGALTVKDPKNDQKAFRIYGDYLFRLSSRAGVGSVAFQALSDVAYPSKQPPTKKSKSSVVLSPFPEFNARTLTANRKLLLSAAGALVKRPDDFASFCRSILTIVPSEIGTGMNDEILGQVTDARKLLKHLVKNFDSKKKDKSEKSGKGASATSDASAKASQRLAVLLAVSLLQLYHEPRPDALDVIQDIKACSDKLDGEEVEEDSDDEEGPDVGEMLSEVLLAMLAESSPLTRQTSLQVFEAFAPFMSAKALENLTDVLAAEENLTGYRALFSIEDGDEEEDDDDDIEMDSDVEIIGGGDDEEEGDDDDEDEEEGEEEDDDEDDDDSEEEEEEEDEDEDEAEGEVKKDKTKNGKLSESDRFEAALRETFKVSQKDDGENDDDDGASESDMSDDAMLALDDALAGHMRLIRDKADSHKKKERAEARRKVIDFKHRVLDLLHVYIRAVGVSGDASSVVLVFRLLRPLVELVRDTAESALSKKALKEVQEVRTCVKRVRSRAKEAASIPETVSSLKDLHASAAHKNAERHAFAQALSTASLAIAATLFAADPSTVGHVAAVYDETQRRSDEEGWPVRAILWADWENWRKLAKVEK